MKRPDHEKSLLGHVPPGALASSSERFTKSLARQLHTWPNQPAAKLGGKLAIASGLRGGGEVEERGLADIVVFEEPATS
ncbi:MAG: hypothetical protein KTR25_07180 [Myxococcales bacterium]|nr:hypothetical protein [Myxococcales bacterium]